MSDSETAVDPLAVEPSTSKDVDKASELSDEVMQIDSDSRGNAGNDVEVVSSGAEGSATDPKKSESVTEKAKSVVTEKASGELIEKRPSLSKHLGETPEEIRKRIERQFEKNPMQKVVCTVCNNQINHHLKGLIRKHPSLGVIICKRCENYYGEGEFSCDEDGFENYCRWCAQGGNLMCCESCKNGFCTKCIKRNLGRDKLEAVEGTDLWHCFLCDSSQIYELQTRYDVIRVMQEKQLEKEKMRLMKERGKDKTYGKLQALKAKREEFQKKIKPVEGEGTKWLDEALDTTYYITNMMQDALINLSKKWEKIKKDKSKNHSQEFAKKLLTVTKVTQVNLSKLDQSVQNNLKQLFGEPFTANVGGPSPTKQLPSKAVTISTVPVTRPGPKSAIARRTNLPPGTVIKKVTAAKPSKPPSTVLKVQITKKKKVPEVVDEITIDSDSEPEEGLAPWELMQQTMTTNNESETPAATEEVEKLGNGIVVSKIRKDSDSDCEIVIEDDSAKARKKTKVNGVLGTSRNKERKGIKKSVGEKKLYSSKKAKVVGNLKSNSEKAEDPLKIGDDIKSDSEKAEDPLKVGEDVKSDSEKAEDPLKVEDDVKSDSEKADDKQNGTKEDAKSETENKKELKETISEKEARANSDDEAKEEDGDKTTCKEASSTKKRKRSPSGSDDERGDASKKKVEDKSNKSASKKSSEKSKETDGSQNEKTATEEETKKNEKNVVEQSQKVKKARKEVEKSREKSNETQINGHISPNKSEKGERSFSKSKKMESKHKDSDESKKGKYESDDDREKIEDDRTNESKKSKASMLCNNLEKETNKQAKKETKAKDSSKDQEKSDKKESSKSSEVRSKNKDPEKSNKIENSESRKSNETKTKNNEKSDRKESSESKKLNDSQVQGKSKDPEKSNKMENSESRKSNKTKTKNNEKSDRKESSESKKLNDSKVEDKTKDFEKHGKRECSESDKSGDPKNKDESKVIVDSDKKGTSNAELKKLSETKDKDTHHIGDKSKERKQLDSKSKTGNKTLSEEKETSFNDSKADNTKTEEKESGKKKKSNIDSKKLPKSKNTDNGKDKVDKEKKSSSDFSKAKNTEDGSKDKSMKLIKKNHDENNKEEESSRIDKNSTAKDTDDECASVEHQGDEANSLSENNQIATSDDDVEMGEVSKKSEEEDIPSDKESSETSKAHNDALEDDAQEENDSGKTKPLLKMKLNLINCQVEKASSTEEESDSSDLGLGTDDEEIQERKKKRRPREKQQKKKVQPFKVKLKPKEKRNDSSDGDGEASDEEMRAALTKRKKLCRLKKRTQLKHSKCVVKLVRMPQFLYYECLDGESINVNSALQICVAKEDSDNDDVLSRIDDQLTKLADFSSLKRKRRKSDSSDTSVHSAAVQQTKKTKTGKEKEKSSFSKINSDDEEVGSDEDTDEEQRVDEPIRSQLDSGSDNTDDADLPLSSDSESGWPSSSKKKPKKKLEKPEKDDSEEKEARSEKKDDSDSKSTKRLKDSLLTIKLSDWDDSSEDEEREKKSKKKVEKEKQGRSFLRIESDDGDSSDDFVTTKKNKKGKESDSENDDPLDTTSEEEDDDDDDDEVVHVPKKKRKNTRRKGRKRSSSSSSKSESEDSEDSKKKKKKRKRIIKASSSEEEESPTKAGRKNIRKLLKKDDLQKETIDATKEEKERKKRIAERQKLYNEMFQVEDLRKDVPSELVLDFDAEKKKKLVEVHEDLLSKLKPHQVKGVKFMYDATIESLERMKGEGKAGSGCILAHCMGLGKTLQVITLLQAILSSRKTKIKHALVVCPLNTVLNWYNEFKIWITDQDMDLYYDEMSGAKDNFYRAEKVRAWREEGGVLIMNYELFRNISNENNKKIRKKQRDIFQEALVDPGPDIIICDEGHLLKNENSALSKAMRRIKTLRRVVLTGTPLQNNLKEYHCMIQFVKPNLLGTLKEFTNRFINPIQNGQCADSTDHDVRIMKRRAHILHNMLDGCVQRADYSVLTPFLPPKHEYVIKIRLSDVQKKLYSMYLEKFAAQKLGRGTGLFADYQKLALIWCHPRLLKLADVRDEKKAMFLDDESEAEDSEGSLKNFVVDGSSDEDSGKSSDSIVSIHGDDSEGEKDGAEKKRRTRADGPAPPPVQAVAAPKWWEDIVTEEVSDNLNLGGKMVLLMEILKACEEVGDKVLVFSQSLLSLNLIEVFLRKIDDDTQEYETKKASDKDLEPPTYMGSWSPGLDYFRMDGSTQAHIRKNWCNIFNREDNLRARLFLISTRAGNMGINLVAANRVIVFDASWNPSHDVQAIFRVYRFGQTKPVYIYRFVAQGTMEEKIYERQVTKQSLSLRVIDEHQIERHFNSRDLNELYTFDPATMEMSRPTPNVPKDLMFAELVMHHEKWIWSYLEHDSLLENKVDEELTEEERKAAWDEYENEKKGRINPNIDLMRNQMFFSQYTNMLPQWNLNGMIGLSAEDTLLAQAREQQRQANQRDMLQRIQMFMSGGSSSQGAYNTNLAKILRQTYPNLPESEILRRVQDTNARASTANLNRLSSNYGSFQNQLMAAAYGARNTPYRMVTPQQRIAQQQQQQQRNTVRGTLASLAAKGINVERTQANDDIIILPNSSTN